MIFSFPLSASVCLTHKYTNEFQEGMTAIIYAALFGHVGMVVKLVELGMDPGAKNKVSTVTNKPLIVLLEVIASPAINLNV